MFGHTCIDVFVDLPCEHNDINVNIKNVIWRWPRGVDRGIFMGAPVK